MAKKIQQNEELSLKTKLDILLIIRNEDIPITDGIKQLMALLGFDYCKNPDDDKPTWYIVK